MLRNNLWPFAIAYCLLLMHVDADDVPTCQPKDFHYEYTECDSEGMRWRVSVPEHNKCTGGAPNAPVRGKDCTFTCNAGQFLDIQGDQECHPCPAGTYSLGGGLRFDDWDNLPTGFTISSEAFGGGFMWRSHKRDVNCSRSTWQLHSNYIAAVPGDCTTSLIFSTKLVKAGTVTFEYQSPNPDILFHFTVQNDQCQAIGDESKGTWPPNTEEGKWKTQTLNLKSGMNVLQWRALGMKERTHSRSPILIRKIEVTGVAYTSECTKCRSGTYSSGGTEFCGYCQENTFSDRGAAQCSPCNQATEYSTVGASKCETRPPCSERDYYEYQTPCDENKQTRKEYAWISPQICNPAGTGAVTLPPQGPLDNCPPCNPGMQLFNNSACEFCPANQFSDGSKPCETCPASTSPEYSLDYRWWSVMPPNVSSDCLSMTAETCSPQAGWLVSNDHIRTHFSHDKDVFLILTMHIPGFRGQANVINGKADIIGHISFGFEINCTGDCELVFLTDDNGKNSVAKSWKGSYEKNEYMYHVRSNKSLIATWAFQPYDWENLPEAKAEEYLNNIAKIYSIKVSNTISGGASECKPCPRGTTKNTCIPCPDGQYIDTSTASCKACPPNTVVSSSDSWGEQACKVCGSGLKAEGGKVCKTDCKYVAKDGKVYDFSDLDNIQFVVGNKLFTSSGTQYYHGFNISLCGNKGTQLPTCYNNVTDQPGNKSEEVEILSHGGTYGLPTDVRGMVCRSTLVPQRDAEAPVVSTQPVSLGDHLVKIVSNDSSMGDLFKEEGFSATPEELQKDIHFHYKSEQSTPACPEGRTTIISLRCDVKQDLQGVIDLPPKCSDGTCDGCTFHFLWKSQHACPICRNEDYEVINGECIRGEQTIHYYPPKHCLLSDSHKPKQMKQKCTTMPFAVQVALPVVIGVGVLLMLLLVYLWKRNKRLEYKYMKLVETAGGRDGELPGVESCGLEEDDEEAVHFPDKNTSIFQKIKNKITSGGKVSDDDFADDDNPFIAVKMQEKLPLT
ncbi:endosome/lysosome-associated apoptosis and autophagy regulator family member 2-like isoform X1 [Haliotis rufescens]|uniref:endosome/lysosome-associated apoptosis and autophagy regulator family member 2-like isoform X1 n=1 Tax=Haliotis rufescens TaxID=6454 RepID=UPI001EB00F0F|nr:endosome/lysosome-associated apoptosis and autophagy regulator family member 2-like isoform X1 [Haliotis rufescens]